MAEAKYGRTRRHESYLEEDRKHQKRLTSETTYAIERAEKAHLERMGAEVQLEVEKVNLELFRTRLARFKAEINFSKQHQETLEVISGQIEELHDGIERLVKIQTLTWSTDVAQAVGPEAAQPLIDAVLALSRPTLDKEGQR